MALTVCRVSLLNQQTVNMMWRKGGIFSKKREEPLGKHIMGIDRLETFSNYLRVKIPKNDFIKNTHPIGYGLKTSIQFRPDDLWQSQGL